MITSILSRKCSFFRAATSRLPLLKVGLPFCKLFSEPALMFFAFPEFCFA